MSRKTPAHTRAALGGRWQCPLTLLCVVCLQYDYLALQLGPMLRCRKPTPPGLLEWCSLSEQDLQGPQGLPLTLGDVCLWPHARLPLSDTEPAEPR